MLTSNKQNSLLWLRLLFPNWNVSVCLCFGDSDFRDLIVGKRISNSLHKPQQFRLLGLLLEDGQVMHESRVRVRHARRDRNIVRLMLEGDVEGE